MTRNSLYVATGTFVLLAASGCVHEGSDGPTRSFTYELWVPLSVLLVGIFAALGGWFLRKTSARFGWGLLVLGAIAAIVFAPSLLRDRAVVDDASFSIRTGIWGVTAVHHVRFDSLQKVRIISEEVRGRRGSKRTNFYLLCETSDGDNVKLPINNKVSQAAAPHFLEKVSQLGIPVIDET